MREIKFRVFCGTDKGQEMVVLDNGEFDNGYWFSCPPKVSHIDEYLSPLMQFTGLKDKNGKDIYEGDVLQWSNNGYNQTGVIEFWENGFWLTSQEGAHHLPNERTVIGNKYENPNLISGKVININPIEF